MRVKRACLAVRTVCRRPRLLVVGVTEQLPAVHGEAAPGDLMLCRCPEKVAGCFFVPCPQRQRRVRRRGDIFLEPAAHLHELRQALHREQEGGIGSACRLEDLCKIPVPERHELLPNYTEHWPVALSALLFAFVALTYNKLKGFGSVLPEAALF